VLLRIVPDKALLGRAAILIWSDLDGPEQRLVDHDHAIYIGIVAGLLTFEELLRAVQEINGDRVLVVSPDAQGRVKCELAILDDRPDRLLDAARLQRIVGPDHEMHADIRAVVELRDRVMHGGWASTMPEHIRYLHLIAKVIIAIYSTVQMEEAQ